MMPALIYCTMSDAAHYSCEPCGYTSKHTRVGLARAMHEQSRKHRGLPRRDPPLYPQLGCEVCAFYPPPGPRATLAMHHHRQKRTHGLASSLAEARARIAELEAAAGGARPLPFDAAELILFPGGSSPPDSAGGDVRPAE